MQKDEDSSVLEDCYKLDNDWVEPDIDDDDDGECNNMSGADVNDVTLHLIDCIIRGEQKADEV